MRTDGDVCLDKRGAVIWMDGNVLADKWNWGIALSKRMPARFIPWQCLLLCDMKCHCFCKTYRGWFPRGWAPMPWPSFRRSPPWWRWLPGAESSAPPPCLTWASPEASGVSRPATPTFWIPPSLRNPTACSVKTWGRHAWSAQDKRAEPRENVPVLHFARKICDGEERFCGSQLPLRRFEWKKTLDNPTNRVMLKLSLINCRRTKIAWRTVCLI